jgi:hypothetical protein
LLGYTKYQHCVFRAESFFSDPTQLCCSHADRDDCDITPMLF